MMEVLSRILNALTFPNFVHFTTIIVFLAFLIYLITGYQLVFAIALYLMAYLIISLIRKGIIDRFLEFFFIIYTFGFFLFGALFLLLYTKDLITMLNGAKILFV